MLYGAQGSGKTRLVGTMPGKGLVIDTVRYEGGTRVLADKIDRIDVLPVYTWHDFSEIYEALKQKQVHYDWIAFDSLTGVQELARQKTVYERTKEEKEAGDTRITTRQEYGKIGLLMGDLSSWFQDVGVHVIFTAQERMREQDGDKIRVPAITPASLTAITPRLDLVIHTFLRYVPDDNGVDQKQFLLRLNAHPYYVTKARAVPEIVLPDVTSDCDLKKVVACLLGKSKEPLTAVNLTEGIF